MMMNFGKSANALLGTALLIAAASTKVSALHYEKPPCGSDEKAVQLMGIDGVFCSPQCTPNCPMDAPDGVTATPSCALQSPDGAKYCAILCSPKEDDSDLGSGDCGSEMQCQPIPNSGGYGICVYPLSYDGGLRASPQDQMSFGIITE